MNYTGKIAHIDLDKRCIDYENLGGDLIRKWGGAYGIASWCLFQEVGPETDALDPANEVWVIGGPLTGTRACRATKARHPRHRSRTVQGPSARSARRG